MKYILIVVFILLPFVTANAGPSLFAAKIDSPDAIETLINQGYNVVESGPGFCIIRHNTEMETNILPAYAVALGTANRPVYIVESFHRAKWEDVPGTRTIAHFNDSYIVEVDPSLIKSNWAGTFSIRPILARTLRLPEKDYTYPAIVENDMIYGMVGKIQPAHYQNYVEELVDVTPSRWSFSELIKPATEYIVDEYASFGFSPIRDEFAFDFNLYDDCMDIFWLNDDYGWIITHWGYLWYTTNGGANWDNVNARRNANSIWFIDELKGFTAGEDGLARTTNGGLVWEDVDIGGFDRRLHSVRFYDSINGIACGDESAYFLTDDGGATWTYKSIGNDKRLYDSYYRTVNDVWLVGYDAGLYHSVNGGQTFTTIDTSTLRQVPFRNITMFNENDGVICGYSGFLAYTDDGGVNWTETNSDSTYFTDMTFADDLNGWVCGTDGVIKVTADGGHSWTAQTSGIDVTINAMVSKSANDVWACGFNTSILYTDNGGSNWDEYEINQEDFEIWTNVIAELPGKTRPDEIYIICGHYDSRSEDPWVYAPGAEDNATGTAGVIHLAQIMSQYEYDATIRFICWTGEEEGLIGSRDYAARVAALGDDIRGVYNMDMIAYMDDANFDSKVRYDENSEPLLNACLDAAEIYVPELELFPVTDGAGSSDHRSFWEQGYPAIMTIENDEVEFYPWYHTTEDTYDRLHYDYGIMNVKLGAALIGSIAGVRTGPVQSLSSIYAYPNPVRGTGNTVKFAELPIGTSIDIYTINGDKVASVSEKRNQAIWNCRNLSGEEVASGVYLYVAKKSGDTSIGKIAVIR